MNIIKKLPQSVITQIAAGQVVERPASVVKELIENSLDAGAKHIIIELESAGKKKIIVTDDGSGMSEEDIQNCFLHHTTSKVFSNDDLLAIATFGFRGEALSSIVSIATVKIESKPESELAGKFIEIVKGTVKKVGSVGMPTGTRITVSGLFSAHPARKKFLKSDATELSYILQTVTVLALAHPAIAFTVIHNKKVVFELPLNETILERATQLLSQHVVDNLLPISIQSDHFNATGFLGKPQIAVQSSVRQFVFVNGRSVYSKEISQKLKEVFSTLLEPRSYPTFMLYISVAAELVDVNVDPQKTRVKFLIEKELLQNITESSVQVLEQANLTYAQRGSNGFYEEYSMDPGIARVVRSSGDGWNIKDAELLEDTEILQVHNVYLVAQTKRGMLIIDQHAAHERILYQEFLENFKSNRGEVEMLHKPISFELPFAEGEFLKEQIEVFEKLGFKILESLETSESHRGLCGFEVTQIPKVFVTRNIKKLIQELLHDCIENTGFKDLDVGTHRTLAYLACRTAIKAGEKLTQKERKRLIEKLLTTEGKYTCPHGRPVEVELDIKYLDQMFKRVK